MAITLFGSASNPADNGTGITDPVVITPPTSMLAGDLVFVTVCYSGTSGTLTVSQAGGQSWTSLTTRNQTRNRTRSFWCIFNGTWTASPSFTGSGTANVIARMLVFRPNGGTTSTWGVDVAEVSAVYAAASPVVIASITTIRNGALVIVGWTSADDNTWGSLSGSTHTFTALTPAQVRNTSGTYQQSQTHAWMIDAALGATGTVQQAQATNGNDAGTTIIMAFYEIVTYNLGADEGNEGQSSDVSGLIQQHNLTTDEGAQAQASDAPALIGTHVLVSAEGAQAQASDVPTLTVTHVLAADEGAQAQASDTPTITQGEGATNLVSDKGVQAQVSGTPSLIQEYSLVVAEGAQAQESDSPVLGQAHNLAADEGAQGQGADSPALTQTHVLEAQEGMQPQASGAPLVTQTHVLEAQEGAQPQASDNPTLTIPEGIDLGPDEGQQAQVSDEARIDRIVNLMADEGHQEQLSDSALLVLDLSIWLATQSGHQAQASAPASLEVETGEEIVFISQRGAVLKDVVRTGRGGAWVPGRRQ